ncbi:MULTISPECIES: hypothetical protein [unclassified Nostoc]|uniref:hypothetical protein n=1 Tax=unclassified Nostoc TaxID=2593658 RepID=UPI0025F1ECEC|nr:MULTISPECIES: hypothetical protein [unclassified Nostoc]
MGFACVDAVSNRPFNLRCLRRATLTHIASMQSLIKATLLISSISLLRVQAATRRQASPL